MYKAILADSSNQLTGSLHKYMEDSYCRAYGITREEQAQVNAERRMRAEQAGPPPPPVPMKPASTRRREQEEAQIDHELRIQKKKLDFERARLERDRIEQERQQNKVHKVTNDGTLIMKDGTTKKVAAKAPVEKPETKAPVEAPAVEEITSDAAAPQ